MWDINAFAVRLLGSLAGSLLAAILLVVALRKRVRRPEDWLLTALVGFALAWHLADAMHGLMGAAGRGMIEAWVAARLAATKYVAVAFAAVAVALAAAMRGKAGPERRFHGWCAAACGVWAAVLAAAPGGAAEALASLAPLIALAVYVERYNVYGLLISRRILFVFTLSVVSALYLLVVRILAGWLSTEYGAFGPVVEVGLTLGAAVTWLPMYQVITRFFSRQNRIHVEFSRRVVEEAAAILDLNERAQYLVDQVGRTFQLARAALVLKGETPLAVSYGPQTGGLTVECIRRMENWCAAQGREPLHASQAERGSEAGGALAAAGYNYVFPLYYQEQFTGMLLVDSSPRAYLDDREQTLGGLSRQISLSIESCRLSELKVRLEKKLLEQQYLASLGTFAATVAHEVKNPLSSIKALAQLLREDADVLARHAQELDFIVGETNRLNSSVQQLLAFARPLAECRESVALSEVLENAAAFLSLDGAQAGVRLERRIEPGLRLERSDRRLIEQVVQNLLLNAVQASPAGGVVRLEAGRAGEGRIRVAVTDQGPGIPEENRERVFEPFFTTKAQGTGLGLAIVRKNAEHLGAALEVSGGEGGTGTRMSVVFAGGAA